MDSAGPRELKRRDTYERIAESGLRLFLQHGYDKTTLDMVAEDVGIGRRTFFAYFKSKDEIVLAWGRTSWNNFLADIRGLNPDALPLDAIQAALQRRIGGLDDAFLEGIVRFGRSSHALIAMRHASFAEREITLYAAICEVWRQPKRRVELRLVAMMTVGALRIAVETWERGDNKKALRTVFRETFEGMRDYLSRAGVP